MTDGLHQFALHKCIILSVTETFNVRQVVLSHTALLYPTGMCINVYRLIISTDLTILRVVFEHTLPCFLHFAITYTRNFYHTIYSIWHASRYFSQTLLKCFNFFLYHAYRSVHVTSCYSIFVFLKYTNTHMQLWADWKQGMLAVILCRIFVFQFAIQKYKN